jgi:hypothetical protein
VLSSGHSALHVGFDAYYPLTILLMMIVLKALASASLDRLRLSRRPVLRLAVPGRDAGQARRRPLDHRLRSVRRHPSSSPSSA